VKLLAALTGSVDTNNAKLKYFKIFQKSIEELRFEDPWILTPQSRITLTL
jgi:hypothetical protein